MTRPSVLERPAFIAWAYSVPATGNPEWQRQAACLRGNPEAWWPVSEAEVPHSAVSLCADCPVIGDCREAHAGQPDAGGVWFGVTQAERQAHRTAARASRRPRRAA